jgi:hypothetical protein
MKTIRIILFILIVIGVGALLTQKYWVPKLVYQILQSETKATEGSKEKIIFPIGKEKLVAGQTYTLKWSGGPDPMQIFLVDTSLKSIGTSVSISDRMYNIKNVGSYDYEIPAQLKPGIYEFQIGDQTSKTFEIVKK